MMIWADPSGCCPWTSKSEAQGYVSYNSTLEILKKLRKMKKMSERVLLLRTGTVVFVRTDLIAAISLAGASNLRVLLKGNSMTLPSAGLDLDGGLTSLLAAMRSLSHVGIGLLVAVPSSPSVGSAMHFQGVGPVDKETPTFYSGPIKLIFPCSFRRNEMKTLSYCAQHSTLKS